VEEKPGIITGNVTEKIIALFQEKVKMELFLLKHEMFYQNTDYEEYIRVQNDTLTVMKETS
jgi:hypothetical protein